MNTTNQLYSGCSFGEMYIRALNRRPEQIAFVWEGREMSYRALGERISQTIQVFEDSGLKAGDTVAHLSGNSPEAIITWASCAILGMRYTPLHPLGSSDADDQIIMETKANAVVVDSDIFIDRARNLSSNASLSTLFAMGNTDFAENYNQLRDAKHPVPLVSKAKVEDVVAIFYTGGTTGKPKGVMHSSRSMVACASICAADIEWPSDLKLLLSTPISHAAGYMVLPVLLKGGTVYLQNGFEVDGVVDLISKHQITATFWVPTMIYVMLEQDRDKLSRMSSLETVFYGAAPMSPQKMIEAQQIFGNIFMQGFGQTEAPNAVCLLNKESNHSEQINSCGIPMTGMNVRILNEELNEVPVGEIGEICISGPLVMDGYLNNDEETQKVFRGGWLHTGDLGRKDERGFIYIMDRIKDMIISGGFNIYPKEVEDVLMEHPAVASAGMVGVPDEKWGEAALAVVVLKKNSQIEASELIAWVKQKKGPVYSPKTVVFVDQLPLTPIGKPDKKAIRTQYGSQ